MTTDTWGRENETEGERERNNEGKMGTSHEQLTIMATPTPSSLTIVFAPEVEPKDTINVSLIIYIFFFTSQFLNYMMHTYQIMHPHSSTL